jgi:hypothetical protein
MWFLDSRIVTFLLVLDATCSAIVSPKKPAPTTTTSALRVHSTLGCIEIFTPLE